MCEHLVSLFLSKLQCPWVLAAQLPEEQPPSPSVMQQGAQLSGENKKKGLDIDESTIDPSSEG